MPPTPSKETTSYRPSRVPEGTPMFRLGAIETILTSVLKIERVLIVDYKANLRHECVSKSRPSGRGHGLQDPAGEISRSEFAASRAQEDKDSQSNEFECKHRSAAKRADTKASARDVCS